MANEEALVLDGLALNDGVTFGMVNLDMPVPRQRQDWIGAADSEAQLLVRNPLHENRKITARIDVEPQASMDLAHDKLLAILDKLQKASKYTDGISLTWTPATGTRTCTFDVLAGEIVDLPVDWENGWLALAPQFTVELTCKPYWRGSETLTSTAAGTAVFVAMEVSGVTGDVPALGRLIVTDTASQSRRHVEWGLEGPLTYNASTSLLLDSDSLVTSGFGGTGSTLTGAYDPNATGNSVIQTSVFNSPQAVCGTGVQSHIGTFRVKARVNNGSTPTGIYWRLAWRVGDGTYATNDPVSTTIPGWVELDLGTITIPTVLSGTQSWDARVESWKPGSVDTVRLDYLVLVPTKNGYGKARAAYANTPGVVAGYDYFTSTTAGSGLNTRSAPAGGTWATSGDTTDYVFADANSDEQVTRATTASETSGRFAILGSSNFTNVQVEVQPNIKGNQTTGAKLRAGVIARWTDSSNYLRAYVEHQYGGSYLILEKIVSGSATIIASAQLQSWFGNGTVGVRLIAYTSGRAIAQMLHVNGSVNTSIDAVSTDLATGGTLATGKPGIFDQNVSGNTGTRYYDNFVLSTPAEEPIVLFSGRNMQVRHDETFRQDSTGTYVGRPQSYRGSRFLVPVGTSRVLVKARRNDIDTAADDNVTDATQIQVGWTPRGLAVPR